MSLSHDEAGFVAADQTADASIQFHDSSHPEEDTYDDHYIRSPWDSSSSFMSGLNNDSSGPTTNPSGVTSSSNDNSEEDSRPSFQSITPLQPPLDPSIDARSLVRLLQCSQCSRPLRDPTTLPCGNTLCRTCIPELHLRTNISYPATANRLQGFTCPFPDCAQDHALGDCSLDVTLSKVMEIVRTDIETHKPTISETPMLLQEVPPDVEMVLDSWATAGVPSLNIQPEMEEKPKPRNRVLQGGRLVATYTMAEIGELDFKADVDYVAMEGKDYCDLDTQTLDRLKEASRSELDCQVCYALFYDPLTTSCGHTFCRKCLHRVLDHSSYCPICRRFLTIASSLSSEQYPANKRITSLLDGLCPDAVAARAETLRLEDSSHSGQLDTPLFLLTPSFPSMPTFLHIFEPRYRLMVRRAMEADRTFGMVLSNPRLTPQGDLGPVPFHQYGTMLRIINFQLLADGRSLIETVGTHRFRVLENGVRDGYVVGRVERVDDVSLAEEEALEAAELNAAAAAATDAATNPDQPSAAPASERDQRRNRSRSNSPTDASLSALSTQELMQRATDFIQRMKTISAPWLHSRVLQVYGESPTDPAIFPWWFASVLPISESEKYRLLGTRSVRERLKICVSWVGRIEGRW